MPIYAYRCASCGFEKDVLQKLSDAPLTECPSCHAGSFQKQVTAAGFQLKGSGWYATDFRNPPSATKPTDPKAAGEGGASPSDTPATPAGGAGDSAKAPGEAATSTATATKSDTPAPAPGSGRTT